MAPTVVNIVCFRFNRGGWAEDAIRALNIETKVKVQETGIAAVSDTTIHGRHSLRLAICNHRTTVADLNFVAVRGIAYRQHAHRTRRGESYRSCRLARERQVGRSQIASNTLIVDYRLGTFVRSTLTSCPPPFATRSEGTKRVCRVCALD